MSNPNLTIILERRNGDWFAENIDKSVWGVGRTMDEALRDIASHYKYYAGYYQNTPDNELTEKGLRTKRNFASE